MKIGRQINSEKKTPAWRWKDRFHRNNPTFNGYAAYVSRPTFDALRRSDSVGERVFNAVCKLLKLRDSSESLAGRHFDDNGLHSFAILFPEEKINCIAVMIGPFDVSAEMDRCKRGIMFHVIDCGEDDKDNVLPEMPELVNLPKDIFVRDAPKIIKLDSGSTKEKVRKKWFEEVLKGENSKGYSFSDSLNLDALDLSAARLLPSDVFIEKSKDSAGFGYCRRFMTRQFNEVRLLGDPIKPNIEQTNTMNAYEFNKSSIMNINGRPGTGKSTILHMLTCESLLQLGPNLGKRRVLYLATTEELITEAKEEIKNLLRHLYLFNVDNSGDKLNKIFAGIDFATEEDFFMKSPGTLGPLDDVEAFKKYIAETTDDADWVYWKEPENASLLQRILRNFVYGVFGSPSEFCKWVPNHRDVDSIRDLFERPFNFFVPNERYIPGDDDLYSSNITPLYFWNPRFDDDEVAAAKRVGGLAKFLENKGGLGDYLIDYSIGKTTGLWDPSGVIHGTAIEKYDGELVSVASSPLWHQMQTEGYDSIFIDESQDFSARTIATLLQYFSNRGVHRTGNYLPFTFVCAGDEFQTIHGTLFQGAMIHINKIFTDWKVFLLKQSTGEMRSFADGLPNPAKISLRATYRTFDSAVDIIDNNVSQMREISVGEGHRRTVGTSNLGYTRTGVVAGLQASGMGSEYWQEVLGSLRTQLEETLGGEVEQTGVKVAMIFPVKRIKQKDELCKQLEVFSNLEPKFKGVIGDMIDLINKKYIEVKRISPKQDPNEKVVAMVKEAGFYDIAAIKGQTHVAVVALNPPINPDNNKRWFDKLLDLSLSLVMVSRSQIGLFIAADNSDTQKLMGGLYEEFQNNEYYIDSCENSDFIQRLKNSAPPVISSEKLFAYALEEWYNPRGWARLKMSDGLGPDARSFVNAVGEIFQRVRIKSPAIQSDFGKLEDLFEDDKVRDITAILGGEAFFEEGAIAKLRHFLHWQMISREYYEEGEGDEVRKAIDKLKLYWDENMPDIDEHTEQWMDLIIDGESSAIENIIAGSSGVPWELKSKSISQIPFPKECYAPRLNIGPWKFTAPPEAEFGGSWVSENQHWSPSIGILQRIIKHTLVGEQNSEIRRKVRWILDYLGQDGEVMIDASLTDYESGDSSALRWIFRTTIGNDSPNAGLWFYEDLKNSLKKKLEDKNPLLLSAISKWLTELDDASDIVKGLRYVENLVKDGTRKSKQLVTHIYANLDSEVLVKWLKLVKIDALNRVPREIIAIGGERSSGLFTRINNLIESGNVKATSIFDEKRSTKIKTPADFATSLFKVKIGSIGEEFQKPLREALKGFMMAIIAKLLSEPAASSRGGGWNLGEERNEEIFNRLKKFDERECPKDNGTMKILQDLKGVPHRRCNLCGYTRKVGVSDDAVEWFGDFNNTAAGWGGHSSLISSIQGHIRSARDARFQYLMGNIRNGKRPFAEQFQTRDAEVIDIGSSHAWPYWDSGVDEGEQWRSSGHLFDWNILGRDRGIEEVPAARFTKLGKRAISLNGKTFDGYMATWRGENDLAYNSFIEGGAIPESQVMLLKSISLGGEVTRLLNAYCKAMMLESRIYLTHVNRRAKGTAIGASWKWISLPPDILEEYESKPKDGQFGVQPYITQMNQYFELHAFLEIMKLRVKENGEAALAACMDEEIGVAVYRKDAFSDVVEDELENKKLKAKPLDSYLIEDIREAIICSSKETTVNRGKIINDFILLQEGYRRASEEGDVNIYLETIMKVVDAPGLQRVFVESSEGGYELDDTSKKMDARDVLLQYLEDLDIFSPAMINHILQQLEVGKREDGIFSDAGEEVSEAYELFCSSAIEKEE